MRGVNRKGVMLQDSVLIFVRVAVCKLPSSILIFTFRIGNYGK